MKDFNGKKSLPFFGEKRFLLIFYKREFANIVYPLNFSTNFYHNTTLTNQLPTLVSHHPHQP
jgi:hypothetical protein